MAIDDIILRENIIPQLYPNLVHDRSKTFAEEYLKNSDLGLLHSAKETGIIFYVPTFGKYARLDKKGIKRFEDKLSKDGALNDNLIKVFDDFYSSEYITFGEYYQHKEYDFFVLDKNIKNDSTLLFTSEQLSIPNYDNWNEKYLRGWDENPIITDFINVYDAIMSIDSIIRSGNALDTHLDLYSRRRHRLFEMFKSFASQAIREIITISMPHDLSYVSSSLVKIESLYSLGNTDAFTLLLKNYFKVKTMFCNNREQSDDFQPGDFINKWICKFGIGSSVKLDVVEGGAGVTIRLYESKKDKKGRFLSEQGYGITQLFVILLRIETAIMEARTYHYFSSRVLTDPLQVEEEFSSLSRASTTIAIEEPEVHQHPKFQSMLADVFVDAYENYNVHFIIETHSEYLIRKLQNLVAQSIVDGEDTSLIYVYDADPSKRPLNTPQVKVIDIQPDGVLSDKFGEGFFDEARRLAMNLLSI